MSFQIKTLNDELLYETDSYKDVWEYLYSNFKIDHIRIMYLEKGYEVIDFGSHRYFLFIPVKFSSEQEAS